jgi:hypothetical protein
MANFVEKRFFSCSAASFGEWGVLLHVCCVDKPVRVFVAGRRRRTMLCLHQGRPPAARQNPAISEQ